MIHLLFGCVFALKDDPDASTPTVDSDTVTRTPEDDTGPDSTSGTTDSTPPDDSDTTTSTSTPVDTGWPSPGVAMRYYEVELSETALGAVSGTGGGTSGETPCAS